MYLGRAAIVLPTTDVPAAAGNPKICQKFQGTLRIFEKFGSATPTTGSLRTVTGELITCFHVGDDPLDAGVDTLVVQQVDEVWVSECQY